MKFSYQAPLSFTISLMIITFAVSATQAKLNANYYEKTCPQFPTVMEQVVTAKQAANPATASATLRLFFHDCMVEGCDASALIATNSFNTAERDADINLSLPGDAFDLVTRAKTALELSCPGIVSCADILAFATRELVKNVGGPSYKVRLGRKDGFISNASRVHGNIPTSTMPLNETLAIFESKGFTLQETVALLGSRTIGFTQCKDFAGRIFNFSTTAESDPSLNPRYAKGLQMLCTNYTTDPAMSAYNDVMTPDKFDNMYYVNLQKRLGLLVSDQELAEDEKTRGVVDLYAADQYRFFDDFAHAMEKLSVYKIKTGKKGEVRHKCDAFNTILT